MATNLQPPPADRYALAAIHGLLVADVDAALALTLGARPPLAPDCVPSTFGL